MNTQFLSLLLLAFLAGCVGGGGSTVDGGFNPGSIFNQEGQLRPTIQTITVPASQVYTAGDELSFLVSWDKVVTISGSPRLKINIGGSTRYAPYDSGSGTQQIIFKYVVLSTDNDLDGVEVLSPMELNDGHIVGSAQETAKLNFISPDSSGVILDGGTPQISTISLPTNGSYNTGSDLQFSINFNRSVDVAGSPRLALKVGSSTRYATYLSGSGSDTLTFRYVVLVSDSDLDGIELVSPLQNNGGSIKSTTGVNAVLAFSSPSTSAILINAISPAIASISVPSNQTYKAGDILNFAVNFQDNVIVTGSPRLPIYVGGSLQFASFISGSGTSVLSFRYVVQSGDWDADGINLSSPVDLNSGSITSNYGVDANLSFTPPNMSLVLIDGIVPEIINAVASSNQSYDTGSNIDFTFTFNRSMLVSGAPRLPLTIGATSRFAQYVSGSGSDTLVFRYTVISSDADLDGIEMDSSLALNGGSITSSIGNSASLTFAKPTTSGILVNATSPIINNLVATTGTYKSGDVLSAQVVFDRPVIVTGTPVLNFIIGGQTKLAQYVSGSGTSSLNFQYTVSSTDEALNGITINSPMVANGGTLKSAYGSNALLTFNPPDTSTVIVDGVAPSVVSVNPPANAVYETGEALNFVFNYNRTMIVTGTPRVQLTVGSTTRYALYVSGSSSSALTFRYTVGAGDSDVDGIALNTSLDLNGGAIKSPAGNNSNLTFSSQNTAGILVNAKEPLISTVTIPTGGTYKNNDRLNFSLTFDRSVTVTGSPRLQLDVGGVTKYATYLNGSGSTTINFRFTVDTTSVDNNGIEMVTPVNLNGGTLKSSFGVNANLNYSLPDTSSIIVDGEFPQVQNITLPANKTYKNGDVLSFDFEFNRAVTVTGSPLLAVTVGSTARNAYLTSGSGTTTLRFNYTVNSVDEDTDGIDLVSPLQLNGGTIKSAAGNSATMTFTAPNTSGLLIDGVAPSVSSVTAPAAGTYLLNENLDIVVNYTKTVNVVTTGGTPRVSLVIGSTTRYAQYVSGSGTTTLLFRYTIVSGDQDTNGVAYASSIQLNGGTIKSNPGNDARLTFTTPSTPAVNVDAVLPIISSFSLPVNKTYKNGDSLSFTANFNRAVTVAGGAPRVSLDIGGTIRYATLASGSGTSSLVFTYVVVNTDSDSDGIELPTSLNLNGSTIKSNTGINAQITFAQPNSAGILVDGIIPSVASMTAPANGTYSQGQVLTLGLTFTKAITVGTGGGIPRIPITVGPTTYYANYASGSGTTTLNFNYSIASSDSDNDGIVYSSPIELNGGTLASAAGNSATLTFTSPNTSGVLIVSSPSIASISAPNNGNYDRTNNANINFTVNFDANVTITGTPRLTLNVGGTTSYATYVSGSGTKDILFRYSIGSTDLDMDGIAVSSPIDLNSGTIKGLGGGNATLTFTSPNLAKVNVVYPDMVVWYDLQDSSTVYQNSDCTGSITANTAVGCIQDKSGKNHPALQATASYKPIYRTSGVNGMPSIQLDGSDDVISAVNHTDFDTMTGLTAIIVFMPTLVDGSPRGLISKRLSTSSVTFSMFLYTSKYMTIDISNTNNRNSNSTVFVPNQNYIATALFDGSLAQAQRTKLYLDGSLNATLQSTSGTAATSTGNFHIGSLNDNYGQGLQGYIGEVIFIRRNLNSNANNELTKIHSYLQAKWGI